MKHTLALGAGLFAASAVGAGWSVARRLTAPVTPRVFDLTIHSVEQDDEGTQWVVLDRTPQATADGIYYATPAGAGLNARDITITTPAGPCPAWRINGDPSTWAIHIHGLVSTRAGTFRGAPVATELGYTSLVVTYRNTTDGPRVGTGRSTLGPTAIADVDETIGYAVRRGAERIVLFGWSMGAAIALQLADRPCHDGLITALVLDSPVLG